MPVKHLLAIAIALLPTAALAQQFTPEQLIEVMTKSPSNRDVRVLDGEEACLEPCYVPDRPSGPKKHLS
tara:strand:+ start:421 stop:627 length:207 start_codon:yes stop_codon:yes gene_type:complete